MNLAVTYEPRPENDDSRSSSSSSDEEDPFSSNFANMASLLFWGEHGDALQAYFSGQMFTRACDMPAPPSFPRGPDFRSAGVGLYEWLN